MILIKNLSLSFSHKTCFNNFTAQIPYGSRIAIIGSNGSGKSSLLGMIKDNVKVSTGYVPQVIETFENLSGGERFNRALSAAFCLNPDLLLLDEPTNHLDADNRKSLLKMLKSYSGTIIIASHDIELLKTMHNLWHIYDSKINIFAGNYDDYVIELQTQRQKIEQETLLLKKQKHEIHHSLMKEQIRASKSKEKGQKSIKERKWPTITSNAKAANAQETSGHKKAGIHYKREVLLDKLETMYLPEILKPKFLINPANTGYKELLSISDASIAYKDKIIISNINLSLKTGERMAILGKNGSGKSTLVKAILGNEDIKKTGIWHTPKVFDIGYLDQHYKSLDPNKSVLEIIQEASPLLNISEARRHLNDYLFRKNEEVNAKISTLSGGEKMRISLAQIGAKMPKLLILDEITNNIDLETKEHVAQVLKNYPGATIIISHDENFLEEIGIDIRYNI